MSADRVINEAVRRVEVELGISAERFSGDWVIRLRKGAKTHLIMGSHFDCNSQAASDIATDKVAASEMMLAAGVKCVPHVLLQSANQLQPDEAVLRRLFKQYQEVVIKPLLGHSGDQTGKFNQDLAALSFMSENTSDTWCAAPYIDIEKELRLIVFNGSVRLAIEKFEPVMENGLKLFNLHRGASARGLEPDEVDEKYSELAVMAMRSIGLELGAVDIVVDKEEEAQVLEVNSGFSFEHYAAIGSANHDQVVDLYVGIIKVMFT